MKRKHKKLCHKILKHYGLSEKKIAHIGEKKTDKIWLIRDQKKNLYFLKRLALSKTPFSILLQQELSKKGVNAPKVYPTLTGDWFVKNEDGFYFLNEYIPHLVSLSKKQRIKLLAKFHKNAQLLNLPRLEKKVRFSSKNHFLKYYTNKLEDLKKWKSRAKSRALRAAFFQMIQQGKRSYKKLQSSDIDAYLRAVSRRSSVCHGDYHTWNCFFTCHNEGLILDFDQSYYGPPLDDFRFLMMSLTRNHIPEFKLKKLFRVYFKYNSKDKKYKKLYLYDTSFPHEFHKQVRKMVRKEHMKKLDPFEFKLIQTAEREKNKYEFAKRE